MTQGRMDENPRLSPVWRYSTWVAGLLCSAVLCLGGCVVGKGKYEATVADLEAARIELEKSRMQYEALQQENDTLRADHQKAAFDLDMLSAEIQQIKEGQEDERALLTTREAALQRDREAMIGKLREAQRVSQKLKSQNRALRDSVRRYQKELEEARKAKAKSAAPVPEIGRPKVSTRAAPVPEIGKPKVSTREASPVVARKSLPKPASPPVAVPFNGTATPININTASANDLVLFLGLTKEVADRVVLNRPYRLRGELIAKQVVPQATFDVIKDRITAAPQ